MHANCSPCTQICFSFRADPVFHRWRWGELFCSKTFLVGGEQQKLSLVYNNAVVDYTGVHFSRCHYGTARCNPEMSGWRAYIILDGVEAATELKFMSGVCMYVCRACLSNYPDHAVLQHCVTVTVEPAHVHWTRRGKGKEPTATKLSLACGVVLRLKAPQCTLTYFRIHRHLQPLLFGPSTLFLEPTHGQPKIQNEVKK